jgi:hypothetical protein
MLTTPGCLQAFPGIETERVILRAITHDDVRAVSKQDWDRPRSGDGGNVHRLA